MNYYQHYSDTNDNEKHTNAINREDDNMILYYHQHQPAQLGSPYTLEKNLPKNNSRANSVWSTNNNLSTLNEYEIIQPEHGIAGFVSKLYQYLQAPVSGPKYARWCNHNGMYMFTIDCITKFTETVLPKLFKHCKFASFVRQLNIYGFQRDTDARRVKDGKGKETCRWYHIYFQPGLRDLFHLIRRRTPRSSRAHRKTVKNVQDPETILNYGSCEDDDSNHSQLIFVKDGNLEKRHASVSSSNSSLSVANTPQKRYHGNADLSFHSQSNYQHGAEKIDAYLQLSPENAFLINSLSLQNQCFEPVKTTKNSNDLASVDVKSVGKYVTDDAIQNTLNATQSMILSSERIDEQKLKTQIALLHQGYIKNYKMLYDELSKSFELMHTQKSRIDHLEKMLNKSPSTVTIPSNLNDVGNYSPNDIIPSDIHTNNTTLYHYTHSSTQTNFSYVHPNDSRDHAYTATQQLLPENQRMNGEEFSLLCNNINNSSTIHPHAAVHTKDNTWIPPTAISSSYSSS